MKKQDENCLDSMETNNDSPDNPFVSFHLRSNLSGSRIQKREKETMTDQLLCNCECEEIPKLKEKAHKSFMQVIQIENLYKEQISQLKEYYAERQNQKDKQYKYKEQLLSEKCKELELELQKVKKTYSMEKPYEIQIQSSPFILDSIDEINYTPLDQSNSSSLFNIKEFVFKTNISESVTTFENEIKNKLTQIETCSQNSTTLPLLTQALQIVSHIFDFMKELKQLAIFSNDKYNDLFKNTSESEGKYKKLASINESLQKEGKFMSQHIKRLSQQKLKMQKKINELQRSNKALEQYAKHIKKIVNEKGISLSLPKKQSEAHSLKGRVLLNEQRQKDVGTLLSTKGQKKNVGIMRNSIPIENIEGSRQVFMKKSTLFQKVEK